MSDAPTLLFYCQHAVGLGHLVRSLAVAEALTERFDVVFLNGGRFPERTTVPSGVRVVNLPPLGHDATFNLISYDPSWTVDAAMRERPRIILDELFNTKCAVVLVELYPFGRKKFEFELIPLLDAVHRIGPDRPLVVSSVRDILVGQRPDQRDHDERASRLVNRYFDAVLVHSDPQFARLEETFRPVTPMSAPVHYTGFVTNRGASVAADDTERARRVLVSAGGGMVGGPLFEAVAAAHQRWYSELGLTTLVVAGPFAPEPAWQRLLQHADAIEGFEVVRFVPDLLREMARSAVSVSQCGYNTAMDIVRARVPSVVVPYGEGGEDEQRRRAQRLDSLGVLHSVEPTALDPTVLAETVITAANTTPAPVSLDLGGSAASARIVAELSDRRAAALTSEGAPA